MTELYSSPHGYQDHENHPLGAEEYKPVQLQANLQRPMPRDFSQRLASKIVLFFERDTLLNLACRHIQHLLMRNIWDPERLHLFGNALERLLGTDEQNVFAGLALLSVSSDEDESATAFFQDLLQQMVDDHNAQLKPDYTLDSQGQITFPHYARLLGDGFISLGLINRMEDAVVYFFSRLIRQELSREEDLLDMLHAMNPEGGAQQQVAAPERKGKRLFDEVIDFIMARARFSETLRGNENQEAIASMADRLRASRTYMIQSLLEAHAQRRRREALKELSRRSVSAEELVHLKDLAQQALWLFWLQCQYNYRYVLIQKVRLLVQSFSAFWGIGIFLFGYLNLASVRWWEGVAVCLISIAYGHLIIRGRLFRHILPEDLSQELEVIISAIIPIIRKATFQQLEQFLLHLVHEPDLNRTLPVLPDFMRYVFHLLPEHKTRLITQEEVGMLLRELDFEAASKLYAASHEASEGLPPAASQPQEEAAS